MHTQVGIIGGGPAGLLLSRVLSLAGISSVVLERRDPAYLRARIRAGLLEQGTVDLIDELGLGARLHDEGLPHDGAEICFAGARHRIDLAGPTGGKHVIVYGQTESSPVITGSGVSKNSVMICSRVVCGSRFQSNGDGNCLCTITSCSKPALVKV